MSVRSLMYSHDSAMIEKFTAALRVLGIHNEPCIEFDRAVKRLYDRFDVVLVDCHDDSGIEFIKQVRASHANECSIVFAIPDSNHARNLGPLVNFQIPKPIDWDLAKRTLRAARTLIHRERRLSERSQMRSSVLISVDTKEVAVRLMDLSMRGMLVQWNGRLELNRRLMVRFNLPDTKIAINCKGRVAWCDERGQTGIEFLNLSAEVSVQMQHWLDTNRYKRKPSTAARPSML